jgi:hypothetical protein
VDEASMTSEDGAILESKNYSKIFKCNEKGVLYIYIYIYIYKMKKELVYGHGSPRALYN